MNQAIILTIQLALVTTAILLLICTPVAWWLSQTNSIGRNFISALLAMPMVLPPTVLGFYLLLAMGPNGFLGHFAFTFTGIVIGSVIYSFPFVVQPLQTTFELIGKRPLELAAVSGAKPHIAFFKILIPMARNGIISAAIMGFAHTVGEFGVVLMIGGNIPGKTQVLSIKVYDHVEALQFHQAHLLSAGLLAFSFFALFILNFLIPRKSRL